MDISFDSIEIVNCFSATNTNGIKPGSGSQLHMSFELLIFNDMKCDCKYYLLAIAMAFGNASAKLDGASIAQAN